MSEQINTADGIYDFIKNAEAGTFPSTDEPDNTDPVDETDVDDTGTGTDDTPPAQDPPQQDKPPANKQDYAFAQMRAQNSQLLGLLGKVAKATGIEYADNNDLISKMNDDALGKMSKATNIPVEILKRMETLEQREQQRTAEQLQQAAFIGFQKVKDAYGLNDTELQAFAQELDKANKNPFFTSMDLVVEYRNLHYDEVVQKKVEQAVQEALKRSNAADKHSTTPSQVKDKPTSDNGEKITTVEGLRKFLDDNLPKK